MRPRGRLRALAEREVMRLLEEASLRGLELARLRRDFLGRLRGIERRVLLKAAEPAIHAALRSDRNVAVMARQRAEEAAEVMAMTSLVRARVHLFEAAHLAKSAGARPEVRRRLSLLVALADHNLGWAWRVYRPAWHGRLSPAALLFLYGFPPRSSLAARKPILGRYRTLRFAPWPGMDN